MLERERKLDAAHWVRIPDLGDLATVLRDERRTLTATYYDTPGGDLRAWGATLRRRDDRWTLKLPLPDSDDRFEVDFDGPPEVVPVAAVDAVAIWTQGAPIAVAAKLRTVRRVTRLVDDAGALLVEVDDDEVTALRHGRVVTKFREIEVEGTSELTMQVVDRLIASGATHAAFTPKLSRALGPAAAPLPIARLDKRPSAAQVLHASFLASVTRLIRYEPAVRLTDDVEAVHQVRVAIRRLRSLLDTYADVFEQPYAQDLRSRLGVAGRTLGRARDADVRFEALASTSVAEIARRERDAAREDVRTALRGPAWTSLITDCRGAPPIAVDGDACEILVPFAIAQWKRLRKSVRKATDDAATLHRIRIDAKRARYAAEALAPIAPTERFVKRAARLQDVLGTVHDAHVLDSWLREHAPTFDGGVIAGRALADADVAKAKWRRAWKRLHLWT